MKKRKISMKVIGVVVVAFAVLLGAAAYLNSQRAAEQMAGSGQLTITRDGAAVAVYSIDDLKKMKAVDAEVHLDSASSSDDDGLFTGVPLSVLLNDTDPALLKECTRFTMTAGDGFSSALSREDLEEDEEILVVYAQDGTALKHFDDGGSGPLRLIAGNDIYGNRSTKYLVSIDCK